MPPRRKQPAAAATRSKQPARRRSKLAKENDLTAEEEVEIQEAFALFATQHGDFEAKEGVLATRDIRRCLIALNAPPRDHVEMKELVETVDPDNVGFVAYDHFVAVAALKMHARDNDPDTVNADVSKAFHLFTRGEDRDITLLDLRRIARELREDVPDNVLKDMVREATGGELTGVGLDDFESVMRRAGVIS